MANLSICPCFLSPAIVMADDSRLPQVLHHGNKTLHVLGVEFCKPSLFKVIYCIWPTRSKSPPTQTDLLFAILE